LGDDIITAHYTAHSNTTNRKFVIGIVGCKVWRERERRRESFMTIQELLLSQEDKLLYTFNLTTTH